MFGCLMFKRVCHDIESNVNLWKDEVCLDTKRGSLFPPMSVTFTFPSLGRSFNPEIVTK